MHLNKAYCPQSCGPSHYGFRAPGGTVCMKKTSAPAAQIESSAYLSPGQKSKKVTGLPACRELLHFISIQQETEERKERDCWRCACLSGESSPGFLSFILPEIKQLQHKQTHSCPFKPALCQAFYSQAITRASMKKEPSLCHHC